MESWSVALSFESVFENNILDFLLNLDLIAISGKK